MLGARLSCCVSRRESRLTHFYWTFSSRLLGRWRMKEKGRKRELHDKGVSSGRVVVGCVRVWEAALELSLISGCSADVNSTPCDFINTSHEVHLAFLHYYVSFVLNRPTSSHARRWVRAHSKTPQTPITKPIYANRSPQTTIAFSFSLLSSFPFPVSCSSLPTSTPSTSILPAT